MKPVECFRWWIVDGAGKLRLTVYRMTREEAVHRFPGSQPDLASRQLRDLGEPLEDWATLLRSREDDRVPLHPA